jgi:peptide/nickel transport system permease protein
MATPSNEVVSPSLAGAFRLSSETPGYQRWVRALAGNAKAVVGAGILFLVVVAAVGAPLLAPADPNTQVLTDRLLEPLSVGSSGVYHLLGTDQLGRDLWSRIVYGARVSLLVGLAAVALAGTIGVALGLLAGYHGGHADDVIMRLADMQLALPFILIATFVAAILGPGLQNTVLVLGANSWVAYARVVRVGALSIREREFVQAAKALGAGSGRILCWHVLPNVVSPVLVIATFAVAQMILGEAALTFLGLGTPPSIPSWGGMLTEARNYMTIAWWTAAFPGLAITVTVIGINLFGDWLRDYLDPRQREMP